MSQRKRSGLSLLLAGLMIGSVMTGCKTSPEKYSTTVVATYGDENIYMDEAYFYARLTQFQYEMYYGSSLWAYDITGAGETFEDSVREDVMSQIYQTYILNDEAAKMEITLNEKQIALVEENVAEFMENEKLVEATRATETLVEKVYTMNALANLVYETLIVDTDREVDEEAFLCKNISYISVRPAETDDDAAEEEDTKAVEMEAVAEEILKKVTNGDKFEDIKEAYDSDDYTVSVSEEVTMKEDSTYAFMDEAWEMKTDEVIKTYVEDSDIWYIVKCNDDKDEEAIQNAIDSEIASREAEEFQKQYEEILENAKPFKVNEKKWAEITYIDDPAYIPETTEENTDETGTEEFSTEEASTEETSTEETSTEETSTEDEA